MSWENISSEKWIDEHQEYEKDLWFDWNICLRSCTIEEANATGETTK